MSVIVVGAGIAGLAAGLAARRAGERVTIMSAWSGATALAGGAWDIAPGIPGDVPLSPHTTLEEQVIHAARELPHHPYARVDGDVLEAVATAHEAVLSALGIYSPLDLRSFGVLVVTDLGLARRAAVAQRAVLDIDAIRTGVIAVASMPGNRICDGEFIASSLTEAADQASDDRRFGAIEVEFLQRRGDARLLPHELAAIADSEDGRVRLTAMLSRATAGTGYAALLLPPLLGIDTDGFDDGLANALGMPVGEVTSALAGAQSHRLERRVRAALEESGCVLREATVERVEPGPKGTRVLLEGGEVLRGEATILATGKLVGGGIEAGRQSSEALAGLPIYEDGVKARPLDPLRDLGVDPWRSNSGHRRGVGYDGRLHALGPGDTVAAPDLFVAGAMLDGFDPALGGGLGCCATTGWLAGLAATAG